MSLPTAGNGESYPGASLSISPPLDTANRKLKSSMLDGRFVTHNHHTSTPVLKLRSCRVATTMDLNEVK